MLLSPIYCCDVTKSPYLLGGELRTSPLHSNRLYVYTVCCRRRGQCFTVLRTRHTDVVGDSSGRNYVTEQGHNVPVLLTRAPTLPSLHIRHNSFSNPSFAFPTSQALHLHHLASRPCIEVSLRPCGLKHIQNFILRLQYFLQYLMSLESKSS